MKTRITPIRFPSKKAVFLLLLIVLSLTVFAEAGAIHLGGGNFSVRSRGGLSYPSLADADALLSSGGVPEATGSYSVINFAFDSPGGHFGSDSSFPNDGWNAAFAVEATGYIGITSGGLLTFGTNNDDGVRLTIGGVDIIVDDSSHGEEDYFGTIELATGIYPLELVFFQGGGGASCEVFIAKQNGTFTEWSGTAAPVQGWELLEAVPEPSTYYVDADVTGANDGSSWEDAFNYLQDALAAASSGNEILVAEGIYRPDEDTDHPDGTGEREATFGLINGVAIKGGYAGLGEPDPNFRDVNDNETLLSGDLLGNDGPDFANNSDNSYHVVTGSGTDETAVLDGFTITAGNANWPSLEGGGMYNELGNPTVMNCTFSGNTAG